MHFKVLLNTTMNFKIILWIVLAAAMHSLFYQESFGFNVLLSIGLGAIALIHLKNYRLKHPVALLALIAFALPSIYNGTTIGLVFSAIGLMTIVGMETEEVRQAFFGFTAGISKLLPSAFAPKRTPRDTDSRKSRRIKPAYFVLPLLLSVVFIGLYASGIPVFGEALSTLLSDIGTGLRKLLHNFSIGSILFYALMLLITAFLVFPSKAPGSSELEKATPLEINKRAHSISVLGDFLQTFRLVPKAKILALKHELRISLILIALLNAIIFLALLAGVYGILHPELSAGNPSYQQVHEGTFNLIVSLVAGAGLVIYFFRGNLNFFHKSKLLKTLSVLWLVQNLLLAVLDGVYNFEYIYGHGLTYKRIGVYFFLFLTTVGLVVVYFKVQYRYSTFKTIKIGLYSAFIFGAVVSPINWDHIIVSYNLRKGPDRVSLLPYTVDLSYRSLPELIEHEEMYDMYISPELGYYSDVLERKITSYQNRRDTSVFSLSYTKYKVDLAIDQYETYK